LCAYYKWLKLNRTWRNGMYWSSGWGTGMDNMPRVSRDYNNIFSHGHMIWLDASLQQIFMANILLKMGFYLERWQEIEEFEDEAQILTSYINKNMWSEEDQFLFDQYADGSLNGTKGIYAYWAFQTEVLDSTRVAKMVAELNNPLTFKRPHRVPSLSASNKRYKKNGRYWQGGVWSPSDYMVITGLLKQGYNDEAYEIARNHFDNVLAVYKNTGTFWEYYSPEAQEPGFMARKDFVGWTGLAPISILIENLFGIRSHVIEKSLTIDVHLLQQYGITKYPFGKENLLDIKVSARKSIDEKPQVTIKTSEPITLTLLWGQQKKTFELSKGQNKI
ncbi:MAG: trehalase family glycosidase, partial [Bacteroidaceae bacterium]